MNGQNTIPPIPLAIANPCVGLLENMLAEAKAGRLTSIAVIGITPQAQVATAYAGGQRGDLYVGAGLLQEGLLSSIKGPPQKPSIIHAKALG